MRINDSWAQSRDLSTDKQNRVYLCVNQCTWSDFSDKKKNFNHDLRNGPKFSFLTVCQFPDLPIDFCECRSHLCLAFYHILMEIYSKIMSHIYDVIKIFVNEGTLNHRSQKNKNSVPFLTS